MILGGPKPGPKPAQNRSQIRIGPGGPKRGRFWGPKRVAFSRYEHDSGGPKREVDFRGQKRVQNRSKTGPKPGPKSVRGGQIDPGGSKRSISGAKKGGRFSCKPVWDSGGPKTGPKPAQNRSKTGPKAQNRSRRAKKGSILGAKKGRFWGPKREADFPANQYGISGVQNRPKTGPQIRISSGGPNGSILEVQKESIPGARKRHKNH